MYPITSTRGKMPAQEGCTSTPLRPPDGLVPLLAAHLPRRLARIWCGLRSCDRPLDQLSERAVRELAAGLHDWRLGPGGTEG